MEGYLAMPFVNFFLYHERMGTEYMPHHVGSTSVLVHNGVYLGWILLEVWAYTIALG